MPEESLENMTKLGSNFAPTIVDHHVLPDINVNGHCLLKKNFLATQVVNLYISYTLFPW